MSLWMGDRDGKGPMTPRIPIRSMMAIQCDAKTFLAKKYGWPFEWWPVVDGQRSMATRKGNLSEPPFTFKRSPFIHFK